MDIQPAAADIQNRHRRIRFAIICTALLAAWLPGGCLRPMLPPSVSVYIPKAQTESLTGKIVVIDPGHGGSEMGAIGQNGLREAEVNLGVALYLWDF